jgi:hypothetical protein
VRYTLNDFLEMRRNTEAYTVFYSTFLPVVVGRSLLKKLVADKDTVEEVATISDEALTLLGLENYGDRWDDIFTRCEGDVRPYAKGQDIPEEHKSTVPTKYTKVSNPDANSEKEGTNKAWTRDGILRFNQLRKGIIQDRAAHPQFLPAWLAHERGLIVPNQATSNPVQEDAEDADDDYNNTASPNQTEELKQAASSADVVDNASVETRSESVETEDFFANREH